MSEIFEQSHFGALRTERAPLSAEEDPTLGQMRLEIRDRLLSLDDEIPPGPWAATTAVLGVDLYRHWSSEHRTALWFPHPFNRYRVEEIYLRYGKSRGQIKALASLVPPADDEPPELGGFPSHGHLAVGLAHDCFFFQFVIGPRAWLDFNHMCDRFRGGGPEGDQLFSAMASLDSEGYEMWWGQARALRSFVSQQDLGDWLASSSVAEAGRDWFVIRRAFPKPEHGVGLTVSSEVIQGELELLFPVFDLAVRRQ